MIDFVQGLEPDRPRVRTLDSEAFKQVSRSAFERHAELTAAFRHGHWNAEVA